uniref:ATPase 8 n=1 Tax=Terrisswalkerius nashi TaxID=169914 RepID=Q94VQ1_9ANNE|nr:ATPase 8 [Terrisswalkerius nashi]
MPHLSPMSWLMATATTWTLTMLFTSNIWWSNIHTFEADSYTNLNSSEMHWQWTLQDGWE